MVLTRSLLLVLTLVSALAQDLPPVWNRKKACEDAFLWSPDGSRVPGTGSWSSKFFAQGPCLQVSGIGTTETFAKTVVVVDRTDFLNTYMQMPGTGGQMAWAEEVNLVSHVWEQRPLNVLTNSFCSSGQHGPNGTFFNVGGDQSEGLSDYIQAKGGLSMRMLKPCTDASCDFAIAGNMHQNRWYPTSQLLGDGRILVVGGANTGVALNTPTANVPSLEYFPDTNKDGTIEVAFLKDSMPFNLYPFVHLLPNGQVFIFAADSYILWDTAKNDVAPGDRPKVGAVDGNGDTVMFSYPLAASSAMFTLSPKNKYSPEIMICGGSPTSTFPEPGVSTAFGKAHDGCWRISPLAPKPTWVGEKMKVPRVQNTLVLLPDGHVLVHGGTQTGYEGIPNMAHNASLIPELYNSVTHSWFKGDTGVSKVPRAYHSSGILLHDATVFFSGSNPHQDGIQVIGDDYPTEFRSEFYLPPYLRLATPTPRLVNAPVNVKVGTLFYVAFRAHPNAKTVSIVLSQPGYSTHAGNHGMRQVELEIKGMRTKRGLYAAHVAAPPSLSICPPTYYWLFVVVDGKPNRDGHHVFVS